MVASKRARESLSELGFVPRLVTLYPSAGALMDSENTRQSL
jgi:hypothetical protein